jgi:phage shock protein C
MTSTRITRRLDDAMLGGVLSGVAYHYNWDPTLLRLVAVLVTIATGVIPGILIYLAAWVIIPREDAMPPVEAPTAPGTATEVPEAPAPGATTPPPPVKDEISEAIRDAANRLSEAATIAAEAARQAANQIGEVARRPRTPTAEQPTPPTPPTSAEATEAASEALEAAAEAAADAAATVEAELPAETTEQLPGDDASSADTSPEETPPGPGPTAT